MSKSWQGEYQIVRWQPLSVVFTKKPPKKLKLKGNASPVPMSYPPKLDAAFDGRCAQTIRKGRKHEVGQVRWIFEWSGKPYRSKWGRRMLVEIVEADAMLVSDDGVFFQWSGSIPFAWDDKPVNDLARRDHIDPPTGIALRDVLKGLNK